MGDHKAESDRVFGGSGVVGIESPVIGRLAIALASVGKAAVEGQLKLDRNIPITRRTLYAMALKVLKR
jgi:hypothetical protein